MWLKIKNSFLLSILIVCSTVIKAQFGAPPPFSIEIEPVNNRLQQGIHSFAFAQSGSNWLIVGGRTNGLHGMSSNNGFEIQDANNNIIVIDTNSWQMYWSTLNTLPYNLADPLRSTNMQYYVDGNYLYMIGGYGWDSIQGMHATFPTLTAIHINNMINAVVNNTSISPHIRQITDTNFAVCGGELKKINSDYFLCFGHKFEGRYTDPPTPLFTQVYTNKIKKFNLTDDGTNISVSNFTYIVDTTNFHRRDLNVCPIITPTNSEALIALGGVFRKDIDWPYLEPIKIFSNNHNVENYQQVMNHYTCANLCVFDSSTQKMYITLFGGISLNDFNPQNNAITLDSLVPFVSDITTTTLSPNGQIEETIMPIQMPGMLGSNAVFVPIENLTCYNNGVLKFRNIPNQRTLAGYILGGIRATGTNLLPSFSNDTVYRVFLTPDFLSGVQENNSSIFNIYPNPSKNRFTISFSNQINDFAEITVKDIQGKIIFELNDKKLNAGKISIEHQLNQGVYMLSVKTKDGCSTKKVVVIN